MKKMLGLACVVVVVGCAHPRHVAVVADVALYEALSDAHQIEQRALCGQPSCAGVPSSPIPGWSEAKSQAFNRQLLPAVDGGRQFNRLLAAWKPGTPAPAQLQGLITGLAQSLSSITSDFPDGTTKAAILSDISRAQTLLLDALATWIAVKGSEL